MQEGEFISPEYKKFIEGISLNIANINLNVGRRITLILPEHLQKRLSFMLKLIEKKGIDKDLWYQQYGQLFILMWNRGDLDKIGEEAFILHLYLEDII